MGLNFHKEMRSSTYVGRNSRVYLSLFILLYVWTYIIPYVSAETRSFISTPMCMPKQRVYNCSFQFSSVSQRSCQIYNTDVCMKNEYPSWDLQPLTLPLYESDAGFTVSILPYSVIVYEILQNDPFSAVNILLTSFNKNISGYSIVMRNNGFREWPRNQNICRIIDFRNSSNEISIPFTFTYDCFHKLTEDYVQNVTITFTAFPLNTELLYFLYIPPVPDQNSTSPCDWKPLVMVFERAIAESRIQLKFSNSPKDMGILFFVVTLMDDSDAEVKSFKIPSNVKNEMIAVEFHPKTQGYYSFSINIILSEKSCKDPVYRSQYFGIGPDLKDISLHLFISFLLMLILALFVLLYVSFHWYLKTVIESSKPSLLLVYFHRHHHHKFLKMYAEYLENHYGVKTYLMYKREGDPEVWRDEVFSKANIIVYVISEGLFEKLDKKKITHEEEHHWVNQLSEVIALINETKGDGKHFCKIYFPYSRKQHVPKCLKYKNKGPLFKLPNDTGKFLCFIFTCSSKFAFHKLCYFNHHALLKSNSTKDDDKKLKEALENIINEDSTLYIKNAGNSNIQNVWKKKLNLDSEDYEANYKMKNGIGGVLIHDSNNVSRNSLQHECKKLHDTSDEKNSFTLSNSSADESGNENTVLVQLNNNSSPVKDDHLISYTSKMVNFKYGK